MSLQFQVEQAAENFKNRIFTWSQTKWYDHSLGYYWMGIISYVHQDSDLPKYRVEINFQGFICKNVWRCSSAVVGNAIRAAFAMET